MYRFVLAVGFIVVLLGVSAGGSVGADLPAVPSFSAKTTSDLQLLGIIGDYLVTVDQISGDASAVAPMSGVSEIAALTFDPTRGTLFGIASATTDPQLIAIDQITGQATTIGPIDPAGGAYNIGEGLAFNPSDGLLYGAAGTNGWQSDRLITIDPATGAALEIASISGTGQNEADALTFVGDVLYFLDVTDWGARSWLYTVDTATGVAALVGEIGFIVSNLAYNPDTDTLFTQAVFDRLLITVSRSTGQGTSVGTTHTSDEFDGGLMSALAMASPVHRVYLPHVVRQHEP